MSALLPCPFCGGNASIISTHAGAVARSMSVGCDNCGCTTPVFDLSTALRSEATAAWNRRAGGEEVERLREALEDIARARLPGVPNGVTVTMEQVGVFAQKHARATLATEVK